MSEQASTLLICTVGGTPDPIVATLQKWRPARVRFIHTPKTRGVVEAKVVPMARQEGLDVDPGRYDLFELPDEEDLESCLDRLRLLTPEVTQWAMRGQKFRVVVDFTGGTKCMSVAVGLQAGRWPCVFSYVGGSERTKDGVGTVIPGTEKVVYQANPWDALGHQAVEDFVVLFDQRAFLAAADVAQKAKTQASRPDRKREFAVLEHLARAFDAWDRFDHTTSFNMLESVAKSANDLRAALGQARGDRVLADAERARIHLRELCEAAPPSRRHVLDLLANAKRRKEEGRFDDAVARLYRAIEAVAQVALRERHAIADTERISLDRLPEALRLEWAPRANDGVVAVGLQDAYALLASLNDPLGAKFGSAGLTATTSPLVARNRSILAHGFERVSDRGCNRLWEAALSLAEITEASLPCLPVLREQGGQ